ncbi:MFS transporter [Microbacterium allomyrinae]|uniref:MFS transporter n=1 Tax=Microbacterium allomyrinae TaxID=2830666 RepID=A0A9X1LX05_9MICO|nr:MFS transporter [Microbacterium allomyrinae]MCC2033261.1 MFS transporter [Microbacterium allomyrinae]
MLKTFRALSIRNFRVYVTGTVVSNVGTWMQRIGQDWLVLELSGGSGTAVGITTAMQFLPVLLLSPLAGMLADRYPKRRLMQATAVMMAVPALVLGILAITGTAEVWHVYVLAFLFGAGAALDAPARQSFVPELVGKDEIANAIGLNSVSFNLARIVGPALAGLLIAAFGSGEAAAGWVICTNAATYLATIWALQMIDPAKLVVRPRAPLRRGMMGEAVRYVRGHRRLAFVFCIAFITGTFGINFQLTNALMATQEFGQGAGGFGLLGSVMAIGSFTGALLAARRATVTSRIVATSAIAFGVAQLIASVMPTFAMFTAWTIVVGLCTMLMANACHASVQIFTDPEVRGRVTALYVMVSMGGVPLGAAVIGWVGETFGPRWTLVFGGGIVLVATLLAMLLLRPGRAVEDAPAEVPAPEVSAPAGERRA